MAPLRRQGGTIRHSPESSPGLTAGAAALRQLRCVDAVNRGRHHRHNGGVAIECALDAKRADLARCRRNPRVDRSQTARDGGATVARGTSRACRGAECRPTRARLQCGFRRASAQTDRGKAQIATARGALGRCPRRLHASPTRTRVQPRRAAPACAAACSSRRAHESSRRAARHRGRPQQPPPLSPVPHP